jgi:GTPase
MVRAVTNDSEGNSSDEEEENLTTKRLDVAIVGYPNAGKSQLLNALLGTKVAAVSRKRHTTRSGIFGVATHDMTQLVFCDTPGFMTHTDEKVCSDLSMTAKGHMADVDYTLVVIDAVKTFLAPDYKATISTLMRNALQPKLTSTTSSFGIVLNKVDLVKPKSKLLDVAQVLGKMADQMILQELAQQNPKLQHLTQLPPNPPEALMPEIFYTCARNGSKDEGVQDVVNHLLQVANDMNQNREWLLPDAHMVTPMDHQARVEEIIREKLYRQLHREVPHQILQRNRQCELIRGDDGNDSSVLVIHQDLLVRTKAHLTLLQKSGGGNLQRIHDAAVFELRRLFQCEVLLTLTAKLISRNRR